MVNELRELLRENVASPPPDDIDLTAVLSGGRRRLRRRRGLAVVGGAALATAAVVALTSLVGQDSNTDGVADRPPTPDAPTLRLDDARTAVEGRDYRVLASYTNDNLNARNGQYFDGVTDDGLILFSDGPHGIDNTVRRALMDPATDEKDWLPAAPNPGNEQVWPVDLGADRLVFAGFRYGSGRGGDPIEQADVFALVYDRQARTWQHIEWEGLPALDGSGLPVLGPDGRLYVRVSATEGQPPPGGWPMGPDGEADDAGAVGDTYHLWSVSLTDPADIRDEGLVVGDVAFTDQSMVWTDRTNGRGGNIHVRDLASGEEHSFDPQSGDRCNVLSFGATDDRIVLGQYCGTYSGGVRDDRVQILSTDGDQIVTIQDSSIEGSLAADDGSLVTIESYAPKESGTYVYDADNDRFLRVSDSVSQWMMGGPTPPEMFLWHTSNGSKGATQWLGEMIDD
jgi:hypothetical protein